MSHFAGAGDVASISIDEDTILSGTRFEKLKTLKPFSDKPVDALKAYRSSTSCVCLARDMTSQELVAIKIVRLGSPGSMCNKYIESEIMNHRKLLHPCVIELKEVLPPISIPPHQYLCLVMEYASGQSLYDHVKLAGHLTEAASRWFFQQLIIGLDYCHRQGVVNRDLKLNNTLVQVYPGQQRLPTLKIADFGYSKAYTVSQPKTKVGTLPFMAPEIFKATGPYDGTKTDIWSAGLMLYWMLFGRHPFQPDCQAGEGPEKYMRAMMKLIFAAEWSVPADIPVSEGCLDLLRHILVSDPAQRYTIQQIYDHPWFKVDLPVEAEAMKTAYLGNEDYSKTQTEEQIKEMLKVATEFTEASQA